ncbi:uncharacterized protein LOC144373292 isoform X2 [Ictidomys tridecemlineatus]
MPCTMLPRQLLDSSHLDSLQGRQTSAQVLERASSSSSPSSETWRCPQLASPLPPATKYILLPPPPSPSRPGAGRAPSPAPGTRAAAAARAAGGLRRPHHGPRASPPPPLRAAPTQSPLASVPAAAVASPPPPPSRSGSTQTSGGCAASGPVPPPEPRSGRGGAAEGPWVYSVRPARLTPAGLLQPDAWSLPCGRATARRCFSACLGSGRTQRNGRITAFRVPASTVVTTASLGAPGARRLHQCQAVLSSETPESPGQRDCCNLRTPGKGSKCMEASQTGQESIFHSSWE